MRIFLLLTILIAGSAQAETLPPECRFLTKHSPSSDVAYKPGVDVNGKAVVPADINAAPFQIPDVIRVPLSVDLIERVRDNPTQFTGVLAEADLGLLEIHKDGRVFFNGQDWSGDIYTACGLELTDDLRSEPALPAEQKAVIQQEPVMTPKKPEPKKQDEELFGSEYR